MMEGGSSGVGDPRDDAQPADPSALLAGTEKQADDTARTGAEAEQGTPASHPAAAGETADAGEFPADSGNTANAATDASAPDDTHPQTTMLGRGDGDDDGTTPTETKPKAHTIGLAVAGVAVLGAIGIWWRDDLMTVLPGQGNSGDHVADTLDAIEPKTGTGADRDQNADKPEGEDAPPRDVPAPKDTAPEVELTRDNAPDTSDSTGKAGEGEADVSFGAEERTSTDPEGQQSGRADTDDTGAADRQNGPDSTSPKSTQTTRAPAETETDETTASDVRRATPRQLLDTWFLAGLPERDPIGSGHGTGPSVIAKAQPGTPKNARSTGPWQGFGGIEQPRLAEPSRQRFASLPSRQGAIGSSDVPIVLGRPESLEGTPDWIERDRERIVIEPDNPQTTGKTPDAVAHPDMPETHTATSKPDNAEDARMEWRQDNAGSPLDNVPDSDGPDERTTQGRDEGATDTQQSGTGPELDWRE